jgi:DNA-binding IclR family transcriptional regulator
VPDKCYAIRRETVEPDVSAAAAPVRGPNGAVVGALSVVGPTFRIDEKKLRGFGRAVALRAAAISAELGYRSQDRTG